MFTRKYQRGDHTYYARVESYRDEQGLPRQRTIEWLRTNPHPTLSPVPVEPVHFGLIATGLMEKTLTPQDIFALLADMGHPTDPTPLEAIGIRFDFAQKKLALFLYRPSKASRRPPSAPSAPPPSPKRKPRTATGSSRSKGSPK